MMEGFTFSVQVRVRFAETDAQGIVNNGAYMAYLEVGRIEFLRRAGISVKDRLKYGIDFVLVEACIQYKSAATADDLLNIHVRLKDLKDRAFTMEYVITQAEDNERVVAKAHTVTVSINPGTIRACMMPQALKQMLRGV
ncbi:MAG: acyl-CoA thioesterase [Deltaproteobacteria bacterium]|nr:acyl-CoA thioesterase [Deltaproteobacteria bacterium]MCL5278146.1 acyl-CoA thioesterase [Deltaproteobacteria bacterium]